MNVACFCKRAAVLLLAAAFASGCAATSPIPPRADNLPDPNWNVYDFEYAWPSKPIRYSFRFANTGDAPVSVTGISVCCGCEAQAAVPKGTSVEPGGSTAILVTCTMPRYEGPVERQIVLSTDDPENPEIPLIVQGRVSRDTVVVPPSLVFDDAKKGLRSEKRLRVFQMSDQRLEISKIEADPKSYEIEIKRFEQANHRGFDIVVGFTPKGPGALVNAITIHTNDNRKARIDVPVFANVVE